MALPTYVGVGAVASGSGALTPGDPTHVAGDVLLLVVNNAHTSTTAATLSDAQDYVAVTSGDLNSGLFGGLRSHQTLFWKRATGSSDNAPTVADNGEENVAFIYAFRGCKTSGVPLNVLSSTADNGGDSAISIAGGTTSENDCLVVAILTAFTQAGESISGWTNGTLANVTERHDISTSIAGEEVHIALATGEMATAGAYGATTATWSTAGSYWVSAGITIELLPDTVVVPTLADGTTADALAAGSASFKYTVTIEGYPYILTDARTDLAVDAWYGTYGTDTHHYEQAIGGLYVSMDNGQSLDWKNPMTRGGKLMLSVVPDPNATVPDQFGIDTHRAAPDAETELASTANRTATTITVKSTSGFDAAGDAWCGTECFGYTGTTATTFTGVTRGKYAPAANGTTGVGFSQTHRVGEGPLEVLLQPLVTSSPIPETWPGKWVVVRLHKYDASIPALNAVEDSLIVFAGKIVAITDDPATGATVVEVKHALDVVADATLGGRDQWSGKIRNTITLDVGMTFKMSDYFGSTSITTETANVLTAEIGAAGDNEVEVGDYTVTEIYQILMTWLTKERVAGRLSGHYSIGLHSPDDKNYHTDIYWRIYDATSAEIQGFTLEGPSLVMARLGFHNQGASISPVKSWAMSAVKSGNLPGGSHRSMLSEDPLSLYVASPSLAVGGQVRAQIDDEDGTFQDQWETLPSSVKPSATAGDGYGIFLVNDRFLMVGYKDDEFIYDPQILPDQFGLDAEFPDNFWRIPWRKGEPDYVDIKQIFVVETTLQQFLLKALLSTGTASYNTAYDTFPYGLGLGIPDEICSTLIASTLKIPHPDKPISALIDKTTRFGELIQGELAVRLTFLRWNNATGSLEFETWRSPTETNSLATLTEENKAAPSGNIDHHRSVTSMDGGWAFPIIKIQYNRSLKGNTPGGNDGFRDSLTIVDQAAVDNAGGDGKTLTLSCLGTFGDFASTGSDINSLAGNFMAMMPYFSRPARKSSRSIDQRYFLRSIGDIVLVDDNYARDPDTGLRGVARYGIITRHSWSLGGPVINSDSVTPQGGDVDLFFLDQNRVAAYVPSAQVDETQTNGGYNAGTKTLTCYEHKYSESTEVADATRFVASDAVRVVEIDPSDPTAPQSWDDVVVSQTGNTIVLTTGLAGWDSATRYRVIHDDYTGTQATQKLKTFQADDADHKVQDVRIPYEYGIGGADATFTQWAAADMVELPPNSSYGDGVGRDVAGDIALGRLLNNLMSYKTSVSSPCLATSEFDGTGFWPTVATWWCIQCRPVWLGGDVLLNDIYRKVAVAPHYKSASGSSAQVRVTLSRSRPTGTSWYDVNRGSVISATTFATSSTTYSTPTPVELDARVKDGDGRAWIYVEINANAKCWGLAHLQVTGLRVLHTLVGS